MNSNKIESKLVQFAGKNEKVVLQWAKTTRKMLLDGSNELKQLE